MIYLFLLSYLSLGLVIVYMVEKEENEVLPIKDKLVFITIGGFYFWLLIIGAMFVSLKNKLKP